MDRRIETRVIDTAGAERNTLIQKDASELWWISVYVEANDAKGLIKLYDGFDPGGKLQWQAEPAHEHHCNFIPPIPCDRGIFIYNDAFIASYTVAYRGKGWPREQKE